MKIISRKDALKKELKFYFTNKPCKYGHIELRRVDNWSCIICYKKIKAKSDQKYSQNPKTKKIRQAIYARYRKTNKYKKAQKKYRKSEKFYQTRKKRAQTPQAIWYRRNISSKSEAKKTTDKRYRQSPKGIATRRALHNTSKYREKKKKWLHNTITGQKMLMWSKIRTRLVSWTTKKILGKRGEMHKIVGCSQDQLRKHLEKNFKKGMTWKNYGRYGWHIDHKKPLSKFNPSDIEDVKKANHYSNLQPMWATENLKKSNLY